MRCIKCGNILNGFMSFRGECWDCTVRRAKENEIFWENLIPDDYCTETLPEKEFVNPFMNVGFKNVV